MKKQIPATTQKEMDEFVNSFPKNKLTKPQRKQWLQMTRGMSPKQKRSAEYLTQVKENKSPNRISEARMVLKYLKKLG